MTASARSLRNRLLIGASAATLTIASAAQAQNLGAGRTATVDPAVAAAQASQSAAQRGAAAQAAAARTRAAFDQASRVRQQMDAAQAAAREAARAAQSNVPNGLGAGGLQAANGVQIDPSLWIGANGPTQSQGQDGRTRVAIDQTQEKAILTWDSFNVGRETDLTFDHHGNSNWMTLNRVTSASTDPTRILGSIKAAGSVYVINPNGVIFGGASQVNVRSLIASSLDIHGGAIEYTRPDGAADDAWNRLKIQARDQRFNNGIIAANGFGLNVPLTFTDGVVVAQEPGVLAGEVFDPLDGVTVEAGARIAVGKEQQAVLLGHSVTNNGSIIADDGQVLLAAGRAVLLVDGNRRQPYEGGDGPAIRGFAVGVDRGGEAVNGGLIDVGQGNITLTGKNVTHSGLFSALTGGERAGSILLQAREGLDTQFSGGGHFRSLTGNINQLAQAGWSPFVRFGWGTVTFARGSHTSILPDTDDLEVVGNPYKPSWMQVEGNRIQLLGDAALYMPSGNVELKAVAKDVEQLPLPRPGQIIDDSRVYIDRGASIDVSGLGGVEVDMAQNEIRAELRANELADNPILRDSDLRGESVYFDGRLSDRLSDGTGIADLSGWYDLIRRDVSQFMTTGGSLSLSGNEVIARKGSIIDLSGGSVRYGAGFVRSTNLIDEFGRVVPIERAVKGTNYVCLEGDLVVNHARWGVTERFRAAFSRSAAGTWYEGYDEGRSAGSLLLNRVGPSNSFPAGNPSTDAIRIFDGTVHADVVVGRYQQDAPTGAAITDLAKIWRERPSLAALEMGALTRINGLRRAVGGNVTIRDRDTILADDFTADAALIDYSISDGGRNYRSLVEGIDLYEHVLSATWFDGNTFGNVRIIGGGNREFYPGTVPSSYSLGGVLTIGVGVTADLGDYGNFSFSGRQAQIDGRIVAPGGGITLEAIRMPRNRDNTIADIAPEDLPVVRLGHGAMLDVAGRWVNRRADPVAPSRPIDGGAVRLAGYGIVLNEGSMVDVSGGARVTADGALIAGDGGSITIDNTVSYTDLDLQGDLPIDGDLVLAGDFAGYALGKGGSLTINANRDVYIGEGRIPNENGFLRSGEPTPEGFKLIRTLVIPAGKALPIPVPYTEFVEGRFVAPGEPLPVDVYSYEANIRGIVLTEDWTVPDGLAIYANGYSNLYSQGRTIPAGAVLDEVYDGAFRAGSALPAQLFPNGFTTQPATVERLYPVGTILDVDQRYPVGLIVPAGTVFDIDVPAVASLRFRPDHFTKGGFASHALMGARGLTVLAGTKVAPAVDVVRTTGAYGGVPNGSRITDLLIDGGDGLTIAASASLDEGMRPAMSLTLRAGTDRKEVVEEFPGGLRMETGASISLHTGSSVGLFSETQMFIDGAIDVPAGTIRIGQVNELAIPGSGNFGIGANARLLARGIERSVFVEGLPVRSVISGGTIGINAPELLLIDPDATLDVSGVRGMADLLQGGPVPGALVAQRAQYAPVAMDGAGGNIQILAKAGIIGGELRLAAGGATGRGGRLSIASRDSSETFTNEGIQIRQNMPAGFAVDETTTYDPLFLTVIADRIQRSGADHVSLKTIESPNLQQSSRGLVFDGDVFLTARRSLLLGGNRLSTAQDGAGVAGDVRIAAPHVIFEGSPDVRASEQSPRFSQTNVGTFSVVADQIDLFGSIRLGTNEIANPIGGYGGGWAVNSFTATGDIRIGYNGAVSTGGDLLLDAAQIHTAPQITVTGFGGNETRERLDSDPGAMFQSGTSITVRSNGNAARVPYSYGERLTLSAPVISQGGVLRAPQGQIRLNASEKLTLLPGSLTTVSLEGLVVPFGYLNGTGLFEGYQLAGQTPTKSITLSGPDVVASEGAVLDVSGGGDLLGWTFVGGNDGGTNLLADRSVERYAILPTLRDAPAPTHRNAAGGFTNPLDSLNDTRLAFGDGVWLDDVPGLAAGSYTLLPAHYALLDGAYLIEAVGGQTAAPVANQRLADGTLITSGYRGVAGTGIREAGYSSFKVMSADVWRPYANFQTLSLNKSARDLADEANLSTVRTPNDAGSVILAATRTALLEATGRFGAGQGGLRGNLDVSAERIALTAAGGTAREGYLQLQADQLAGFEAGSVLLGGTRSIRNTGTVLTTAAREILVAGDVSLNGSELLLASRELLTIEDGATLTASGTAGQDRNALRISGDGALVRLSSGDRVGIVRTGASGSVGTLSIGNAALVSDGSLSLDGSAIDLAEATVLDVDQLDLASVRVNLGDVPAGEAGTTIGLDALNRLASARDLLIRGHQSISFFTGATLGVANADGSAGLGALTFDTAALVNRGDGASVTARTLTLRNSGRAADGAPATGAQALNLNVDRLTLESGSVGLNGFSGISGETREIALAGAGALNVTGSLSLATGRIFATQAADYRIGATGDVTLTAGAAPVAPKASVAGARLQIAARNIRFDTVTELTAGDLELTATGGDLVIGETARLILQGSAVEFADTIRFAAGGMIRLNATGGVSSATGAVLDVSGAERGGDAGTIAVAAGGQVELNGAMLAKGHERGAGGSFDLDADAADFAALNTLLNAGRFTARRDIHLRDQGITLAADARIEAHRVTLRSGTGDVRIDGTIAANGNAVRADGGVVRLTGKNIVVGSTARIEAAAATLGQAEYQPASGSVVLAADSGRVELANGATVDLSGGRQGGGRIIVRAARTEAGADVDLNGTVTGARERLVIGSRIHGADVLDAQLVSTMMQDAGTWLTDAWVPAGWSKGAGIIVRSAGDLSVIDNVDLHSLDGGGYFGLEAGGNLVIDADISDGFASADRAASLLADASFSLGLDAAGDIVLGDYQASPVPINIAGGQPLDQERALIDAGQVTFAADWLVPSGVEFITTDGNYYFGGRTVPAGSTISTDYVAGKLPAGYILPAAAFPDGLTFPPTQTPFTGEPRIVRTGTGDIDIAAGRDLKIGGRSAVYTAGRATDTRAGFVRTDAHGYYPTQGGDIRVVADRDILSAAVAQSNAAWWLREGQVDWTGDAENSLVAEQTSWSVAFGRFEFGLGALGGGNIAVRATRDVQDLAVAVPTTGHLATAVGRRANEADLEIRGGGDLFLTTGRDLLGGVVILGRGRASLDAGRDVSEGAYAPARTAYNGNAFALRPVNLLIGLSDAQATVQARGDVAMEAAFDPMLMPQLADHMASDAGAAWESYSDRAGLWATSYGGDVTFYDNSLAAGDLSRGGAYEGLLLTPPFFDAFERLITRARLTPPTLSFASLTADVRIQRRNPEPNSASGLLLAASPVGNIELLSSGSLDLRSPITLQDIATAYRRTALAPFATSGEDNVLSLGASTEALGLGSNFGRGFTPLHLGDDNPIRLVALTGNIGNYATAAPISWTLNTPKPFTIFAGTDIVMGSIFAQHNDEKAVSAYIAGRDVVGPQITFLGQGLLYVEAGRSIAFTNSQELPSRGAIISSGNTRTTGEILSREVAARNTALPDIGGDIHLVAGTAKGTDYEAFAARYLDAANRADSDLPLGHPTNVGKVVHTYEAELSEFLSDLGFSDVTAENRTELFGTLPAPTRQTFLTRILTAELRETGKDYNDSDGPRFQQNVRGYSAVDLLFPKSIDPDVAPAVQGDINLRGAPVQTFSGGDINLIAPYGSVTIGYQNESDQYQGRGGVVTRREGDISILANRNIALETSRTFTLQGGDILMWTSNGDITAGAGAKTSVFNLPLKFTMAINGEISLDRFGLSTGAGIGVLDALQGEDDERAPSRLDLIAFRGEVNAGDAGIRVVGDINIAALRVVNAANIEVSGEAVGIPQVPAVNVGALNAASSATAAVVNEAAQLAERNRPQIRTEMPTILNVRFLGFGE